MDVGSSASHGIGASSTFASEGNRTIMPPTLPAKTSKSQRRSTKDEAIWGFRAKYYELVRRVPIKLLLKAAGTDLRGQHVVFSYFNLKLG